MKPQRRWGVIKTCGVALGGGFIKAISSREYQKFPRKELMKVEICLIKLIFHRKRKVSRK